MSQQLGEEELFLAQDLVLARPHTSSGQTWARFYDDLGRQWRLATTAELEGLGWEIKAARLLRTRVPEAWKHSDEDIYVRWLGRIAVRTWEPALEHGGVRVCEKGIVWEDGDEALWQMDDFDARAARAAMADDFDKMELFQRAIDGCAFAAWNAIQVLNGEADAFGASLLAQQAQA